MWTNVFFFQFPGIRQKPGKGNFRDFKNQKKFPGAPLEACSLGPSFRKSVSIYPRSAPETGCRSRKQEQKNQTNHKAWDVVCDWFILPLVFPTLTIWFSLDHKRNLSDRVVNGVGRSGNVLILLTPILSCL